MSGRRTLMVALVACATFTTAPPARATITPRAQELVDRYVAATGGADALAQQRAFHLKGHVTTMALKGTFERWAQAPDRVRIRFALGTLRFVEGFDGVAGWRTDLGSKQVTLLDGKELERLRSEAYFANTAGSDGR